MPQLDLCVNGARIEIAAATTLHPGVEGSAKDLCSANFFATMRKLLERFDETFERPFRDLSMVVERPLTLVSRKGSPSPLISPLGVSHLSPSLSLSLSNSLKVPSHGSLISPSRFPPMVVSVKDSRQFVNHVNSSASQVITFHP